MEYLKNLGLQLSAFGVFRALLQDPVISRLHKLLLSKPGTQEAVSAYGDFAAALYDSGFSALCAYIADVVGDNENPYIRAIGRGVDPGTAMEQTALRELEVLQQLAELTPEQLSAVTGWDGMLPGYLVEQVDIPGSYKNRCANIGKYGYGSYARHKMFYVNPENRIVPVHNPDTTRLCDLIDYEREQKIIMDNTVALLEGRPAANILLTGDAGTGKSSTVKAVVNELYDRGLRILEVRKEQLHAIPAVLDELAGNPLKFILFIDDLSFGKDDGDFSVLKAILEGSVSAKASNIVIYATSNRRHLVKETFSDRDGDDVRRSDTMQEIISLSERFGIQITFCKPAKATYLDIVHHLALQKGLSMDEKTLEMRAEQFALSRGGRSARAARQLVDQLLAEQNP